MQTIFLKDEEAEMVKAVRNELIHHGLASLDKKVVDEALKKIDITRLTNGAVVALACAVLLHYISKNSGG